MKHLLGLTVLVIALASSAFADGMPSPGNAPVALAPYNWSGAYVGVHAGGAWGDSQTSDFSGFSTPTYDIDGAVAGGTFGYNWQSGKWVIGVETDISWSDISGSVPTTDNFGCGDRCETEVEWFGTARVRVGHAFDRFLVYGTGGLAYARLHGELVGAPGSGTTTTKTSWTVGAGSEYAFGPHLSGKVEYLYVDDFEDFNVFPDCVGPCFVNDTGFSVVRVGLNFKFGGRGMEPVPLK